MWACPVRNWIRWLNVLWSKSMKCLVGVSMGVSVFAAWKPELGVFGRLLHLWIHASSISFLCWDATNACIRRSLLFSLILALSPARWSAFSFLAMPAWPGTQLMAIRASFTSFRMSLMCFLKDSDCAWAFPGVPLYICEIAVVLSA